MSWWKIQYNKRSAKKYGWDPSWFGTSRFDDYLIDRIQDFQRLHDLEDDGLCGPKTYRRAFTNLELNPHNKISSNLSRYRQKKGKNILCGGEYVSIDWDKVDIDLMDPKCYRKQKTKRKPTMVVTHWDAALSAGSCKKVLERRGISSHFVIDNDGTIVQLVDCNNIAWHAGIRRVNNASIGIDFSNAYYLKYQKTYVKRGFGPRPVLENSRVHGVRLKSHLGYYPVQVEAYKALIEALNKHYGIPLECPMKDGELLTKVHTPSRKAKFNGIVCHYHLTRGKIDTAGLELDKIIKDVITGKD